MLKDECVTQAIDDTLDVNKAVARCAWSRPGDTFAEGGETDADWRYERDPDHDGRIPGLMRLQHKHVRPPCTDHLLLVKHAHINANHDFDVRAYRYSIPLLFL